MSSKKSRNFCLTVYGIGEDLSDRFEELVKCSFAKTVALTYELGKSGENEHIQMFIVCSVPNRISNVKNKINELFNDIKPDGVNPHIEVMQGSVYQNLEYITKELKDRPDAKHCLYGDRILPVGKKRDDSKFESYTLMLKEGKVTLEQIEEEDLAHYVRHEAYYLSAYSKICKKVKKPPTFVAWFSGTTGTGKSYTARKIAEVLGFDVYEAGCDNGFFNVYNQEKCSIWDDYRSGPISFAKLLKITDKHGDWLNIKGGKVWFNPTIQIYTSPSGIDSARTLEMGYGNDMRFAQLKRRVKYACEFESSNDEYIPTFGEVERNSKDIIKSFLGAFKTHLRETGFEECIKLLPCLLDVEEVKLSELIKTNDNVKLSFKINE